MLIFFQKAGAGLFYHNLFHANNTNEIPSDADKSIGYSCTCIDDFLLPFEGAEQVQLSIPVITFHHIASIFEDRLPFSAITFTALRGPPAING